MKLIYLNYSLSSVFESQVLDLLVCLQEKNHVNNVHLCCGYNRKNDKEKIEKLTAKTAISVTFFKVYPNFPFYNFLNKHALRKAIYEIITNIDDLIIHVRGESAALHLKGVLLKYGIPSERVLVDIRGAGKEEILEFKKFNPLLKCLKIANYNRALRQLSTFHNINAVSPELKNYILEKTQILPDHIVVISNLAGNQFFFNPERRKMIREELGVFPDDVLFLVSSGGTGLWQNNEAILALAKKGYKALNLSRVHISHPNVINKFVPYNSVPDYLSASDIAVIMRKASIVNKVASPVKFSEFICSGLPIITNKNINLIQEYVEKTGFGFITLGLENINPEIVQKLLIIPRKDIADYGKANYGLIAVASRYMDMYLKMLN